MSWQLGCFAILGVALAAGFGWYERSRPDARVVALVATLAALAALGRIAFAALPNVKPTTDIVLIAGYALGGAPGFAVGATAGLTSNFFFGQGPWTPWQMFAWGGAGLLGALLARVGPRIGRWPLAVVCAVVGYAFAAFQDLGDWVNFSDHSAAQLGVYLARGTGFDLIHAGGCLAFALAFGPAFARALRRFTMRLEVTWLPSPGAVALMAAGGLAGGLAAGAVRAPVALATGDPVAYLLRAQNPDGGFGPAPGAPSSELFSGWAALGLASAGHNPADAAHGGASLLAYLQRGAGSAADPGAIERAILVAAAAGENAADFGGRDLVLTLRRLIRRDGSISEQVNLTAFAVLALRGAGAPVPVTTAGWLAAQQNSDGGFNFGTRGGASDIDDTGAVLEALGARGRTARRATRFLAAQQSRDGGFPAQPGTDSNAQSTAWAIQGLLAAGGPAPVVARAGDFLRSLIAADGHVRYSRGEDQTPVWVTAQALMALERKPLPVAAAARVTAPSAPRLAHPAPAPRVSGRRKIHRRRPGASRLRHRHLMRSTTSLLDRLATGAGVVAAVVYAPAGI